MLYFWLVPLLVWLFLFGAAVGSFLNVVVVRLGLGKSLLWPGSCCGACFAEVRLKHNIPLVSYWWLRGRCSSCGVSFSIRYFFVELFVALAFVGLYLVEIGFNVPGLPTWDPDGFSYLEGMRFPPASWGLFAWHAALASLLIAVVFSLFEFGRVPRGVTAFGFLAGVVGATLFAWPYPSAARDALTDAADPPLVGRRHPDHPVAAPTRGPMPLAETWATWPVSPHPGFVPWPVWGPLPCDGPLLGLATALAGGLGSAWLLRLATRLARGGLDGAEVALIAGPFLGWQPMLLGLVLAAVLALALGEAVRGVGGPRLPFALWLAVGVVAAWLGWGRLGPPLRPLLFHPWLFPGAVALALALLVVTGLVRRLLGVAEAAPFVCRA